MDPEIMWTVLSDPRFNSQPKHSKDDDEKNLVKMEMISNKSESRSENENNDDLFGENEYENVFDLFGENETIVSEKETESTIEEKAKAQAQKEVSFYCAFTESVIYTKSTNQPSGMVERKSTWIS